MRVAFRNDLPDSSMGRPLSFDSAYSNAMIVPDTQFDARLRHSNNRRQRADMNLRAVLVVAVICAVGAALAWGQSLPDPARPAPPANFGVAPEDAYLSPTRYTSAYFGFSFDFPDGLSLRPVPQPGALDRRIQLLELIGPAANRVVVSISAYEHKNKNYTDAKSLLRRELDQEVFSGIEQVHGVSKTAVGDRPFYYFESRKGQEQHIVLAAEMNGYVVQVDFRSRNVDVLHQLFAAFTRAEFFAPREAERRAGVQAAVYQGPAITEQHLLAVRESKPADRIAQGKVAGRLYSNSQIGVTYEFPQGWSVAAEGAIEPAVVRYREKVTGEPILGPRERGVVKACRKTLLSVWKTRPGADGEVPYDEFGEVTLSAMPLACFPNIRFPSDVKDAAAVQDFVVGIRLTQPLQRDMTEARTYEAGGRPFVLTHGTIAYKEQGEALSRRISLAMAMTPQRGYLLIWLFAAPHDAELRELMAAKIGFEADTEPATANSNRKGSGEPAASASTAPSPQPGQTAPAAPGQTPFRPSLHSGADGGLTPPEPGKAQVESPSPH